ncbi:hypothetical protein G6N05_03265 [Flavobacterium sp. F372]|uniref:Leucine-rich repeat domain-containing protein n=1 Tax=Flavobacterium bernardetii TaxID=2813823 RepID=A0ABR7IW94_9FLAO|nr:hypothetical protein [Flavobacterium bernardetii]MBC5833892.1 hypothetical protein [Flavobacterium bernardetii]NHF69125.1 hypothetical protein [Flavobacterium bernardetii]
METVLKIGNHFYDSKVKHLNLKLGESVSDAKNLFNLREFTNLKSICFADSDLNDEGLAFLSILNQLESLNLQGTSITNDGIKYLAKLENLTDLRLKENPQLTNECIPHLIEIENLEDLQIHETSINYKGLEKLIVMKNLKDIVLQIWDNNFTYKELIKFSISMPNCIILAKGNGKFLNGSFEGEWTD